MNAKRIAELDQCVAETEAILSDQRRKLGEHVWKQTVQYILSRAMGAVSAFPGNRYYAITSMLIALGVETFNRSLIEREMDGAE